jgi:hypothetical protein
MSRMILCRGTKLYSFYRDSNSRVAGREVNSKILSLCQNKKSMCSPQREVPTPAGGAKGSAGIIFLSLALLLVMIVVGGAFYLYQVNDMATKGFEIKDLELQIQALEKERRKMEIKEVELRSMYNIERSTEELNLITPPGISYIEAPSPVAMK